MRAVPGGSRRARQWGLIALKLCLATFSVLMVVSCFEFGLRLMGFEAIYEIYSKSSTLWRPDPVLGWHHIPNSSDVFVGPRPWPIEFETPVRFNSLGLRGPEVPPRSEDDVRLLFLGDSMVVAMEVEYDDTFVARIAEELGRKTGQSVRSINAGVRGYGTDQSLLYFRDRGRLLEPDLVVFFHSGNDPRNNRTLHRMRREMGKPVFLPDEKGGLKLVGSPVPDYPVCSAFAVGADSQVERLDGIFSRFLCRAQMILFDRSALFSFITLRIDWNPKLLGRLYYTAVPETPTSSDPELGTDPAREITLALLAELKREVEAAGARFLVTGEQWQLEALGLERVRSLGIRVEPLPRPKDEEAAALHFIRDSHYSILGHERVVERLLPPIEELLAEPRPVGDGS